MDNYILVFPHPCPQMWMNYRGVLRTVSFMIVRRNTAPQVMRTRTALSPTITTATAMVPAIPTNWRLPRGAQA